MFLLDTNVVSELVKRAGDAKVAARLAGEPQSSLFISSVTGFRTAVWSRPVRPGRRRSGPGFSAKSLTVSKRCRSMRTMPWLRLMSCPPWQVPAITGLFRTSGWRGVATNRGLTLVTRNVRHFDRILNLRVENWFD